MKRREFIAGSLMIGSRLAVPSGAVLLSACGSPPRTSFRGPTMGTVYDVSLVDGSLDDAKLARLRGGMEDILEEVITQMSTYEPDSALSRFNKSSEPGWQAAPEHLVTVLDEAARVSAWSGGTFDATVGPLVDLWGFGPGGARQTVPSAAQLERVAARVGHQHVKVDASRGVISKDAPVELDLSAIAKGYAADRMGAFLDARGVRNYLIDIGGELRAGGRNDQETAWRVAIERPEASRREVQRVVELSDRAIATSGDYRNFFQANGQRYSHTIDPRRGRPVEQDLAAVTVVHDRTMTADAMATALLVAGTEQGFELAQRSGIAAHFMVRRDAALVERSTEAMQAYLT